METNGIKNQDLPAFASVAISGNDGYQQDGLTKREYFAAMALQGLLSNQTVTNILSGNNGIPVADEIAKYSLQYSDALLSELDKK